MPGLKNIFLNQEKCHPAGQTDPDCTEKVHVSGLVNQGKIRSLALHF